MTTLARPTPAEQTRPGLPARLWRHRRLTMLYSVGVVIPAGAGSLILLQLPTGGQAGPPHSPPGAGPAWQMGHVLLVVAVLVAAAHLGGVAAARLRQPRVVGQAVAGLLLGPVLLGRVAPATQAWLHAGGADRAVDLLAQLGVILFVFLIARELTAAGHGAGPAAFAVGHTMVAVPAVSGILVALTMLADRPAGVGPVPFVLFLGVAMGATALPVLGHILAERHALTSPVGALATSAAAVGDATLWCLLSVALALAGAASLPATLLRIGLAVAILAVVVVAGRPLLRRLLPAERDSAQAGPALLLAGVLALAVLTDTLGLHAIFGAFVAGLVLPARSVLVDRVTVAVGQVAQWLLLPLFFAALGARTGFDGFGDARTLAQSGLVVVAAVVMKVVAGGGAARAVGFGWRDSTVVGVLMNCRGMTEFVVLGTGLSAGVIGPGTFTTFVVMAILTTAVTGPLLDLLDWPDRTGPTQAGKPATPAARVPAQTAGPA